jgi:hypothetical protein
VRSGACDVPLGDPEIRALSSYALDCCGCLGEGAPGHRKLRDRQGWLDHWCAALLEIECAAFRVSGAAAPEATTQQQFHPMPEGHEE